MTPPASEKVNLIASKWWWLDSKHEADLKNPVAREWELVRRSDGYRKLWAASQELRPAPTVLKLVLEMSLPDRLRELVANHSFVDQTPPPPEWAHLLMGGFDPDKTWPDLSLGQRGQLLGRFPDIEGKPVLFPRALRQEEEAPMYIGVLTIEKAADGDCVVTGHDERLGRLVRDEFAEPFTSQLRFAPGEPSAKFVAVAFSPALGSDALRRRFGKLVKFAQTRAKFLDRLPVNSEVSRTKNNADIVSVGESGEVIALIPATTNAGLLCERFSGLLVLRRRREWEKRIGLRCASPPRFKPVSIDDTAFRIGVPQYDLGKANIMLGRGNDGKVAREVLRTKFGRVLNATVRNKRKTALLSVTRELKRLA